TLRGSRPARWTPSTPAQEPSSPRSRPWSAPQCSPTPTCCSSRTSRRRGSPGRTTPCSSPLPRCAGRPPPSPAGHRRPLMKGIPARPRERIRTIRQAGPTPPPRDTRRRRKERIPRNRDPPAGQEHDGEVTDLLAALTRMPHPQFIEVGDGVALATYSWGEPDAPTVVLVHGFASS